MKILGILLIIGGLAGIGYYLFLMFKKKNNKNSNLKSIYELKQSADKLVDIGKGDEYAEYVSLIGKIKNTELVNSPFTKKPVAYCEAMVSIITERKETFKDSIGNDQTKIITKETVIMNSKLGSILQFVDLSTSEAAVLEINCGGCELDVPVTIDEKITPEQFDSLNLNIYIPDNLREEKIIGYKIKEKSIENETEVYVVGEARVSGRCIHICLPKDLKRPFIVTTNKKEIKSSNNINDYIYLIAGGVIFVLGIIFLTLFK